MNGLCSFFIRIACCWHDVLMMRVCAKLKNAANDCAQCRKCRGICSVVSFVRSVRQMCRLAELSQNFLLL